MKRSVHVLSVFFAAAIFLLTVPFAAVAAPQFTGAFNFLENRGPNTVGFSEGLKFIIGANVAPDNITLSPIASVRATHALGLGPDYDLQQYAIPIQPGLWQALPIPAFTSQSGRWTFTATDQENAVSSVTAYILNSVPPVIPLVPNVAVLGGSVTPTIYWDAIAPPSPPLFYRVRLMMTSSLNQFFQSPTTFQAGGPGFDSASGKLAYTVPPGVLAPGAKYTARIQAIYSDNAQSPGSFQSVSSTFVEVPTNSISAGYYHTVATTPGNYTFAWGYNDYGQLGDGTATSRNTPVPVVGQVGTAFLSDVAALSAGYHTLALKSDGSVLAWGAFNHGQLGNGTTDNVAGPTQVMEALGIPLTGVASVAAGENHSLALKTDGSVWAWGFNDSGQIGSGGITGTDALYPSPVVVLSDGVTSISAGMNHSLAVYNGDVMAWGENQSGQLGDGSFTNSASPVGVRDINGYALGGAIAVAGGRFHSVALKSDGTVWTWGRGSDGQLGNASFGPSEPVAVQVGLAGGAGVLDHIVGIAAGCWHTVALKSDGTVWAWGRNTYGQLGTGDLISASVAMPVYASTTGGPLFDQATAIAAGCEHTVAQRTDGSVWVWGNGDYGQVGNGQFGPTVQVLNPFQAMAAGGGSDADQDGVPDSVDNCPNDYNPGQADEDGDGVGDLCDNCPTISNPPDIEFGQQDVCSTLYFGDTGRLSPVLVQGCFQFEDPTKEYVVRPTCANTVWELTTAGGDPLVSTVCVNGPAVGIPDDLVPMLDSSGNPITYCTEPCNLLDRFSPDVLTALPGETITYQARGIFTTLIQCPPGDSIIPLSETDPTNVCPKILMVSVTTDPPITLEILPEKNRLIDVYPGTYPNLINIGATGTTPVAIIGSPDFDITKVDLATVTLAGVHVDMYTDKKTREKVYRASTKDFNGDGYLDLIVHFVTSQLGISAGDTTITLTGNNDGVSFTGEDSIQVVRRSKK